MNHTPLNMESLKTQPRVRASCRWYQIVQYDDGVAVQVPRKLAEQLHFAPGDAVDIGVRDGVLTVSAHGCQRRSLSELLEGITPENLPDENFDDAPTGTETL